MALDKTSSAESRTWPTEGRRWTLSLLVAIYASNFVDRTIINVLQQPIKAELGLQDWQLGLLGGTSFAIFYTLLGVYVARLAERHDRIRLLSICIVAWSVFTMLCGAVTAYFQLLLLRIGVAVGEAGATPTGQSLISDHYPPERRAGALAVFASGNTIGQVLGALLAAFAGQALGWRWTFVLAGAPGLLLALLAWRTLQDPRRSKPPPMTAPPATRVVAGLLFATPTFRHLAAAAALTLFATYGINAFVVPYLMRAHGLDLQAAGLLGGVGGGVMLGVGTLGGGFIAQGLARRDRRWILWTPALFIAIAAPLCLAAFASRALPLQVAAFLAMNACIGTFQGPLFATLHSLVEPRSRPTASAILLLTITLFGLGLGPLLVGLGSDLMAAHAFGAPDYATICSARGAIDARCLPASAEGLRLALLACAAVLAWAALHFALAARTVRTNVKD